MTCTQRRNTDRLVRGIVVTCAFLSGLPESGHAQVVHSTVALSDDPAPGTSAVFDGLERAVINERGQVAFTALLSGDGVNANNNLGLWLGSPGQLALVARQGTVAAGTNETFGEIDGFNLSLNDNGHVGFFTGSNISSRTHLWSGTPGDIRLAVKAGDITPGINGRFDIPLVPQFGARSFEVNNNDQIAVRANFIDLSETNPELSDGIGIWSGSPENLGLVARTGDPAPGTALNFAGFGITNFNDDGVLAFSGWLRTPAGAVLQNSSGIWMGQPGDIKLVALEGQSTPGTGETFNFGPITFPLLNDRGQVVFSNFSNIWVGTQNTFSTAMRSGDIAPGTNGAIFNFVDANDVPNINNQGQIAFNAFVTGSGVDFTNDAGMWVGTQDSLTLVMREGAPAPGTNVFFSGPDSPNTSFSSPWLADHARVAFVAGLEGDGVDRTNDSGIWAGTPGNLLLVVRDGDLFDVDPGPTEDLRVISNSSILDLSQDGSFLAFRLHFTDGTSGFFVATVPEPSTGVLLLLVVFAYLSRLRCRVDPVMSFRR